MVLSYYIYKYPYKIVWHLINVFNKKSQIAFYCADPLDYEMFLPILKYLPSPIIIAKNNKTRKYLKRKGIMYVRMPSFPAAVIMARQSPYKFPVKNIVKIGFDHGLYQFKRWTSAKNYNGFNIYFVSSDDQVETGLKLGINSIKAIGYPKLDKAFDGEYDSKYLKKIKEAKGIDPDKKTILFTTTWDVAGLSAIEKWIDKIELLTEQYNVLVTVHTWTKESYKNKLRSYKNVIYLEEFDVTHYLMIADVLVGDYSSIIGEFCAFDKPIITFKVPDSDRTIDDITNLIRSISIQIDTYQEIHSALKHSINNPEEKSEERLEANKILFYALDGQAGKRAADEIKKHLGKTIE
jgi:CDP-glycerol glycerophosphotransferase (TagB/SpsB family)